MPVQTSDDLQLINERVILGPRKKRMEKPPEAEGAEQPADRAFIETVEDLIQAHEEKGEGIEEVCKTFMARFSRAVEMRKHFEEEWYFSVRAWFQQATEQRELAWESDRYLPIILKQVETALPSIVAATLDSKGVFRMQGMTREGKNAAKALERLQNFQVNAYDWEEAYEDMYWWAALLGTGYLDHGWDRRTDMRTVPFVEEDEQGKKSKSFREEEISVADNPTVETLNPLDVFPSPNVEMGDDGDWFFERVPTSITRLRQLAEPLFDGDRPHISQEALERWISEENPEDLPDDAQTWADSSAATWNEWLEELGYDKEQDEGQTGDKLQGDRRVVVLKYRSKRETITFGSPKRIIGYSRNKMLHGLTGIIVHHFFKIPNCPFGRGIGGILKGHQELSNENINRWMDSVVIEAMAPIVVDKSRANLLDEELVLQPNAVIRTRGVDAIQRMQLPAPTNLAMTMDSHIAADADDLTGFNAQLRGQAQGGTATAVSDAAANLQTRLVMHVRRSGRTLKRSGQLLAKLNQQFYSKEQIVSFVGEDGMDYVEIEPWEIVGDMVVGVSISPTRASPEMRAQRVMQMFQLMVPLLQGGALQQPQVRRMARMALEANEIEDVDLLLPKGGEKVKDAGVENILLRDLVPVAVNPAEPHDVHIQAHQQLLKELAEENADQAIIENVQEHVQEHVAKQAEAAAAQQQAAQGQQAQQAQGASGAGIGVPGGTPAQSSGASAAALTPGSGTPGVSAPGPAGPGQQQ